jgi:hypothetical protein
VAILDADFSTPPWLFCMPITTLSAQNLAVGYKE